jgi:hypothetical protein
VARIELPDGSQQPRIGIMVPEASMESIMATFEELQPDQPWLQVVNALNPVSLHPEQIPAAARPALTLGARQARPVLP